ncbi:MAG TPA: phosphoglycerate mutase [Lachnospiraceae bacterium]|nr:phosphoglycerate mutase [Lachnospiraceae bacterium]
MILYVIRHGETSWNKQRRLQGQHGADLDSEGVLLAEKTRDGMKDIPLDLCYTSPLIRARHTAEIVCQGRGIPILEEKRVMEIAFGIWEGKCCDLNRLEIPRERYLSFHEDPWNYLPPEGGESVRDVVNRCHDFYEELIHNPDLQEKSILISTHGCASRAFLNSVYEDKTDFWHGGVPMNCAVSKVVVENGRGRLEESDRVYYGKEYYHNFYQAQRDAELNENK